SSSRCSVELDVDVLDAAILLYTRTATLLAVARVFGSSERGQRTCVRRSAVDGNVAHLESGGDPMGTREVGRLHVRGQSVGSGVGHAHCISLVLERQRGENRSEHLLLSEWAFVVHSPEKRRSDEIAVGEVASDPAATGEELSHIVVTGVLDHR